MLRENGGHMTSLYEKLKTVRSEEDVKDIYIKALGMKSYTKGLIDIRTDEMWFRRTSARILCPIKFPRMRKNLSPR